MRNCLATNRGVSLKQTQLRATDKRDPVHQPSIWEIVTAISEPTTNTTGVTSIKTARES